MSNLPWDRMRSGGYDEHRERGLDPHDPCEIDPPAPLQMFTRLGVMLMVALVFAVAAEILVRLPPH
jgi:hypothetical protein